MAERGDGVIYIQMMEAASLLTTSPCASRYFFSTLAMTAREDLTSEMARRPWSYSFWASTITKTLSFGVGFEGSTPRKLGREVGG